MVGAGDLADVEVPRGRPEALEVHLARAELVVAGEQQQAGLGHGADRLTRIGLDGERDEGAPVDARLARRDPAHGARSEREATREQGQPREAPLDLVERRHRVAFFGALPIVLALGAFNPTEVEAQHRQPRPAQALGGPEHHRVIHRAAVRGVRMAHDRDAAGRRIGVAVELRGAEQAFQTADRAVERHGSWVLQSHGTVLYPPTMESSPHIIEVRTPSFEADVVEASLERPVVLEFYVPDHPPSEELAPLLAAEAAARGGKFLLARLNVATNQDLAAAFRIEAIPTVLMIDQGRPADGFAGNMDAKELAAFLDRFAAVGPGPLLVKAREQHAEGQFEDALATLETHLEDNVDDQDARLLQCRLLLDLGRSEEAGDFFDCLEDDLQATDEGRAIRALLDLEAKGEEAGDLGELQAAFDKDPSTANRFALAKALLAKREHERGLEHLLHIVTTDRKFEDDAARKLMLETFDALGPEDPIANDFRYQLQMVLFV